ncbi:MAG: hypothetical protein LUG60_12710 [Erysipelotrichaceae bacterium]|nr:hypothetical protein [Erysipelotrichaceae bacterium]
MKKIKKYFTDITLDEIYMVIVGFTVTFIFPLILVMSMYIGNLTYELLWSIAIVDMMIMFISVIFTSDLFMNFFLKIIKIHIILIAIGLLVIY